MNAERRQASSNRGEPVRVMALAYWFAPSRASGSIRNTNLLAGLPAHGLDVEVVTISGRRGKEGGEDPALLAKLPAEIRVRRTRCAYPREWLLGKFASRGARRTEPATRNSRPAAGAADRLSRWQRWKDLVTYALALPDRYNGWLPFVVAAGVAESMRRPPDVLYAVGQPWTALLAGCLLKSLLRRPLVVDLMDPWGAAQWDERRPPGVKRVDRWLERSVMRRADHIIVNTDEVRADFLDRLRLPPEKLSVIPCGYEESDFHGLEAEASPEALVLSHAGTLYGGRNPASLLRAVASLIEAGEIPAGGIRLRFVGERHIDDPELDRLSRELQDVVEWLPPAPHREALRIIAGSSGALLIQPGHALAIPAKLYEYAALRKPILAIADAGSAVDRILRREGWGSAIDSDDQPALREALLSLYRTHQAGEPACSFNESGLTRYKMKTLSSRLAAILRANAGRGATGPSLTTV